MHVHSGRTLSLLAITAMAVLLALALTLAVEPSSEAVILLVGSLACPHPLQAHVGRRAPAALVAGRSRTRRPSAWAMALVIAGATAMFEHRPRP